MQIPKPMFMQSSEIPCYLVPKRGSYWRIFLFPRMSGPACLHVCMLQLELGFGKIMRSTQPPTQMLPKFFSVFKVPESDSNHLTPPSTQLRHEWVCTSNPTIWVYGIPRQNLPFYTRMYQQRMRKTPKASGGITSVPFGIRTCYLPNRSHNRYCSLRAQ